MPDCLCMEGFPAQDRHLSALAWLGSPPDVKTHAM